ncbi:hypothetical protein JW711_02945 [Candidatus Woesearchaeota archaeon]|nr:hypothetical protein [Candidatus Woesearchaeota archaeon]
MEIYENAKKAYYSNIFEVARLEENVHLLAYSLIAFFTPFLLGHPQLLVGSIVNGSLILGATYLKGHKMLPIIMLPSLGVLAKGMVFGPYTILLMYMIPFIWVSNAIIAYVYRGMRHRKINYAASVVSGAVIKTAFLFSCAYIFVSLGVLPALFLTTMGLFQLYTALIGGAGAYAVIKVRELALKGSA